MENKTIGQILKEKREEKKLTFQMVNEDTRISIVYLQAMENDNLEIIPAAVYRVGFLKKYSAYLGLDQQKIVEKYQQLTKDSDSPSLPVISREPVSGTKNRFFENSGFWKIVLFLLLPISGMAVLIYFSQNLIDQIIPTLPEPKPEIVQPLVSTTVPTAVVQTGNPQSLSLEIKAIYPTWIKVAADDLLLFEGLLNRDETKSWEAANKFLIRIGYLKGVRVKYNGELLNLTKDTAGDVKDLLLERKP